MIRAAVLLSVLSVPMFAGALLVEIGNPAANSEARSLNAVLVARTTACHEPAKTSMNAQLIRMENGQLQRSDLTMVPLKEAGAFAITGVVPASAVIEISVTNPEYKNYKPTVLVRTGASGPEWTSAKHFFSVAPNEADIKAELAVPSITAKR